MPHYRIAVVSGDGIGPEVMAEGVKILRALAEPSRLSFAFEEVEAGATCYQRTGEDLPRETLQVCQAADAILFGAAGLPDIRLPDGTEIAANLDRVLMAFDASVEAKRAAAAQGLEASETAAQAAFQNLGAGEAWIAMLDGYRNLVLADPARKPLDCELPADPRNPGG